MPRRGLGKSRRINSTKEVWFKEPFSTKYHSQIMIAEDYAVVDFLEEIKKRWIFKAVGQFQAKHLQCKAYGAIIRS